MNTNVYKPGDYKNMDRKIMTEIQEKLIQWYEKSHRKLPWRETNNPYFIWISEVMLQQTRVDTVIPYFLKFINQFPTIHELAKAEEEEVLKAWEGLGYYSRARNMHRGAKVIMDDYGGIMPKSLKEIRKIPGIGPYTGGAVLSIAYGVAVPAVDGNVMRVFSRIFHITEDIGLGKTRQEMEIIGGSIVSTDNPSSFNQGLMELGALICTPTSPKCGECPLYKACTARKLGVEEQLPVKLKKPRATPMEMEFAVVYKHDKILIVKRPSHGLLANLWALPVANREQALNKGKSIQLELEEMYGLEATQGKFIFEKHHIFTHLKWLIKVYLFEAQEEKIVDYPEVKWIKLDEVSKYPFPKAFMKVINEIGEYISNGEGSV